VPEENINACLYNKLIDFKPGRKWAWELQAAKSIEQTDPTHIRFELKEGIMHSGGFGDITAEWEMNLAICPMRPLRNFAGISR
jgi:peptide/nickel transport system substrate-binding protein